MHFLVSPDVRLSKDVTKWVVVAVAVGIGPLLVYLHPVGCPSFPIPIVTGYCPQSSASFSVFPNPHQAKPGMLAQSVNPFSAPQGLSS